MEAQQAAILEANMTPAEAAAARLQRLAGADSSAAAEAETNRKVGAAIASPLFRRPFAASPGGLVTEKEGTACNCLGATAWVQL